MEQPNRAASREVEELAEKQEKSNTQDDHIGNDTQMVINLESQVKDNYFKEVTNGWDEQLLEKYGFEVRQDAEIFWNGFAAATQLSKAKEDEIRELREALEQIAEYNVQSHEDGREMRDIAKAVLNKYNR